MKSDLSTEDIARSLEVAAQRWDEMFDRSALFPTQCRNAAARLREQKIEIARLRAELAARDCHTSIVAVAAVADALPTNAEDEAAVDALVRSARERSK